MPASLLSEQTGLINICPPVLTLGKPWQLLVSIFTVPSVLILVCSFEYSRGYTFGRSLAVARVN